MGATIVDGLDTLIIMGLQDEANDAIEWIESNLSFNQVCCQPVEITLLTHTS